MYIFRKGRYNDINSAITIGRELPEYFTEDAFKGMNKDFNKHDLYIVENDQEVIGFCSINIKNESVGEISWLGVKPSVQRNKIGSKLIDYITKELKQKGIKLLEVKTLDQACEYEPYERTRKFYQHCNFIHIESIAPYPGWDPGNPCAIYVRVL